MGKKATDPAIERASSGKLRSPAAAGPFQTSDVEQKVEAPISHAITGSCLCGGVRFEVDPPFVRAGHCHCSRCRKHSGTFGLTQARVQREQFRLLQGADLIRVYGRGQGAVKAFCTTCGSSLFGGTWPDGPQISIRMGAFDGDPGIRPQFHTYVGSRAPWDEITDTLPQYQEAWAPAAPTASPTRNDV